MKIKKEKQINRKAGGGKMEKGGKPEKKRKKGKN